MFKTFEHKQRWLLVLGFLFGLITFLTTEQNYKTTFELVKVAEHNLHQKEDLVYEKINVVTTLLKKNRPRNLFKKIKNGFEDLYKKEGIVLYVYQNDSLVYWSDNEPAIDFYQYANQSKVQLLELRNGWHEYIKHVDSLKTNTTVIALVLLKPKYDYENKYLNNDFSNWLGLPELTKLNKNITTINYAVKSKSGAPLFEISRNEGLYSSENVNSIACVFFYLAAICFGIFWFVTIDKLVNNKTKFWFSFSLSCFLVITIATYFKWPHFLYNSSLYNPKIFADASSFYFGYLGDIVSNALFIFLLSIFVYKTKHELNDVNQKWLFLLLLSSAFVLIYFSISISNLIFSLTNNSTISYNINELFNFSTYSLIGYTSIGLLLFSFYLCLEKFVILILVKKSFIKIFVFLFFGAILTSAIFIHNSDGDYLKYLWPIPLYIIAFLLRKFKASYNFINIGLLVLTSTILVSNLFYNYETENKRKTFEALSYSLSERQDVIAENEFIKISNSIQNDIKIKNLLSFLPLSAEKVEETIRQLNFSGYFERYEIVLSLFKSDCSPVFKMENQVYLSEEYFTEQIEKKGIQTICDELFFIDIDKKPIRYIAKIPIEDLSKVNEKSFTLYVQLEPKLANNIGLFPDLLLDKSLENKLQTKNISYGVYSFNKLQTSYGEFQYPLFYSENYFNNESLNDSNFEHHKYNVKQNTRIVISEVKIGIWNRFTSNSYLFIFFSTLVLISIACKSVIKKKNLKFNSLNNRIQFIFVVVVFLSLTGVVIGTVWVVNSQFENKNKNDLITKAQLVYRELQSRIGSLNTLDNSYKDFTTYTLKKQSVIFSTDISLFTKDGALFATSQPTIYEQGLISKFMNPVAYASFYDNEQANFSHRENIGKLNYLSAYIPFYNTDDRLVGYINLPYFSRQKDLEKELTAYLTTLINIYTILFALSTLVALVVSNLLTKPLRIIQQQISKIQFGKPNESLFWQSNDEIGKLVSEYNTMLIKLDKSSELLAKSERESAWREMAKQVAHEIKNPLTPMKLNIQHLQRIAQTNPEDMRERIDKVSLMLVEQIDTLSHIATEFSNFAKLPKEKLEKVNITEVIKNMAILFIQSSNCQISLVSNATAFILADKDQCIRIFTNLLKNAEQSIPEDRIGQIDINLVLEYDYVVIKISDNGCGISESIKEKLFTPNFTTKSTGTGLGLAMVKNSVKAFNGDIDFTTELNVGTTFTITFPIID